MKPKMRSPKYTKLLRRHTELLEQSRLTSLTGAEWRELYRELCAISDAMTAIELAHEPGAIEAVTDDYAQLRQMGDLGGTEL